MRPLSVVLLLSGALLAGAGGGFLAARGMRWNTTPNWSGDHRSRLSM